MESLGIKQSPRVRKIPFLRKTNGEKSDEMIHAFLAAAHEFQSNLTMCLFSQQYGAKSAADLPKY